MKLNAGRARTDQRRHFFTKHMVKLWNSLPKDTAMTPNLDGLKGDYINS